MGITYGDHLIDSGYYDPEEESMPMPNDTSEWQPIETAPRGIEILGCWVRGGCMGIVTNWEGNWEENDSAVSAPSHWMPLPAPPSVREG